MFESQQLPLALRASWFRETLGSPGWKPAFLSSILGQEELAKPLGSMQLLSQSDCKLCQVWVSPCAQSWSRTFKDSTLWSCFVCPPCYFILVTLATRTCDTGHNNNQRWTPGVSMHSRFWFLAQASSIETMKRFFGFHWQLWPAIIVTSHAQVSLVKVGRGPCKEWFSFSRSSNQAVPINCVGNLAEMRGSELLQTPCIKGDHSNQTPPEGQHDSSPNQPRA